MSNETIESILGKLSKMQAIADDPNANENIVKVALLKIQSLLDKHNISKEELDAYRAKQHASDTEYGRIVIPLGIKGYVSWLHELIGVIARGFSCEALWLGNETQQAHIAIIGQRYNATITAVTYAAIRRIAEHNATLDLRRFMASNAFHILNESRSQDYRTSYLHGFAAGLERAFDAQRAEADHDTRAMIIANDELLRATITRLYGTPQVIDFSNEGINPLAFYRGIDAGKTALAKQLPQKESGNADHDSIVE